jgi:bifunctional non-homologous end joining protein LigD
MSSATTGGGSRGLLGQTPGVLPRVLPMKAVTGELPANDEGWAYEIKWDGMRLVAYVNDEDRPLRLESTRGHDAVPRFPELQGFAAAVAPHVAVLDGEVVAFEGDRPNFGRLQMRMQVANPTEAARRAVDNPIYYVVFDIMHLDGHDLTDLTYLQRRELLRQVVEDGEAWRVPSHWVDDGAGLLEIASQQRLEGIMAKRKEGKYLPGKRSPTWIKIKVRDRQEFVIGGWQPGAGQRTGQIGSLLVGYYHDGELRYAGKVGTGFKARDLSQLGHLLGERAVPTPPFTPPPPPLIARTAHWVRPDLVAEITFGEWTSEGILRHASYLGLRSDKEPSEVVRET